MRLCSLVNNMYLKLRDGPPLHLCTLFQTCVKDSFPVVNLAMTFLNFFRIHFTRVYVDDQHDVAYYRVLS